MPMPEAAVHEDNLAAAGEGDVGLASQIFQMDSEAIAHRMQDATHAQLGLRVFRSDRLHDPPLPRGRTIVPRHSPSCDQRPSAWP